VASVQANSVPISGDMKAGTATVHHRGGCLEGEFAENWPSDALCRARSARKAISPPDRRQAAPIKPLRGPSSDGVLVDDVDRLFISGLAVVEILHANRAVRRRIDFSLMRVRGQTPQAQMAEDPFYDFWVIDEADDLHFMGVSRTAERVHLPDSLYELPPCFGRHPAWPMVGHIQHGHLGGHRRRRRLIAGFQDSGFDPLFSASARIRAVVSDHLKILLRDMLSDGGDEFFGREDLEVRLVAPVGHEPRSESRDRKSECMEDAVASLILFPTSDIHPPTSVSDGRP